MTSRPSSGAAPRAGYTPREVAALVGLPEARVREYIRDGVLDPGRGEDGEYRLTLQDLVLLRTARELSSWVAPRKLRRALRRLRDQLPATQPLTGVRLSAEGSEIVARDGRSAWEPDSGQGLLEFETGSPAGRVSPLVPRAAPAGAPGDGEDWYAGACDLEARDPEGARAAYLEGLASDPAHHEARLNLGRLLHEAGEVAAAETHYRRVLEARPGDVTAAFNLGVALEDLDRDADAAVAYEVALTADPACADAHFNLARLHERAGRHAAALRHLKAYRLLVRPD